MILYKNTFENIKTLNCDFPIEDQYYALDSLAVVADGITRDPIGIFDLSSVSFEEMIDKYPRPSGAELASKEIVNSFNKFSGNLKEQMMIANEKVKILNSKYIKQCDYLQNDYYGAVASCAYIYKDTLFYAYICDCGIIVYDKSGNVKFQTRDDKEIISDPYINKIGMPWNIPEARVIVRRDYRNNLNNIKDGVCVSYGAITGEESATNFIREGSIPLSNDDIVIVYTDGFTHYLYDKKFIEQILKFDSSQFEEYLEQKQKEDYEKYGKERTLVIMKK